MDAKLLRAPRIGIATGAKINSKEVSVNLRTYISYTHCISLLFKNLKPEGAHHPGIAGMVRKMFPFLEKRFWANFRNLDRGFHCDISGTRDVVSGEGFMNEQLEALTQLAGGADKFAQRSCDHFFSMVFVGRCRRCENHHNYPTQLSTGRTS